MASSKHCFENFPNWLINCNPTVIMNPTLIKIKFKQTSVWWYSIFWSFLWVPYSIRIQIIIRKLSCFGKILTKTTYANVPVPHASIINRIFWLTNESSSKGPVAIPTPIPVIGCEQRLQGHGNCHYQTN